jgi:hypothetical protein
MRKRLRLIPHRKALEPMRSKLRRIRVKLGVMPRLRTTRFEERATEEGAFEEVAFEEGAFSEEVRSALRVLVVMSALVTRIRGAATDTQAGFTVLGRDGEVFVPTAGVVMIGSALLSASMMARGTSVIASRLQVFR